ncbi:MAG: glycosyltransferase family 4 protein [Anaerolineae bacterium]
MKKLVSFRPGVIAHGTAFEAMALMYKYLQEHYGYEFTIVKSEDDVYDDPAFKIISIPRKVWKPLPYLPFFPMSWMNNRLLDSIFAQADGILTVDPTTAYLQGLLAIRKAYRSGKPVWFDASSTIMGTTGRTLNWKLKRRFLKEALQQTTGIIVTVPKCIERFTDMGLFDEVVAPKFTVMGHPVDTTRFALQPKLSEQDGILRVLVISRLVPEKGLFYIIEAMTQLLQECNNIQLQILGSGPMKPLLEREVVERNLSESVIFLSPVPHADVSGILGSADIFVNHAIAVSRWEEFFGVANIEAMSCGLPCILTRSGSIPYVIREKDVAVLVEERNIAELREAITQFVNSEQKRREMGKKARDYVKRHYALPVIAEKYHWMLQHGFGLEDLQ